MEYFSNINVRSNYSFLSSAISLTEYIRFAKKYNLTTLFLTDKNVMHGAVEFLQLCQKNKIKPIIGLDCKWKYNDTLINLTLISKSFLGYKSLIKISSIINTKKNDELYLVDTEVNKFLVNNLEIIIIIKVATLSISVLTGAYYIVSCNNKEQVFLGISKDSKIKVEDLLKISTLIVPTNTVKYLVTEHAGVYQVLKAIKNQIIIKETELKKTGADYYLTFAEMQEVFPDFTIKNINKVVNLCNWDFPNLLNKEKIKSLPEFTCPDNLSAAEFLQEQCKKGLQKRLNSKTAPDIYIKRLLYELEIINLMGFNDYFLIVADYTQFARTAKILYGPGRGSAAGSLVAYVLEITNVDPIKYNLIFERFLNPERTSLPDIDIDFQDERREEIIQYLADKYGQDHVAHVLTFQTLANKMAIRDLGRVFNISLEEVSEMSKLVASQYNFNLDMALKNSPKLTQYSKKYSIMFKIASFIIGFPRQTGTHAAGIVLTKEPLFNYIPIQLGFNNVYQTQYAMNYLEDLGLIKMDILGLRNLTILKNILDKVDNSYDIKLGLDSIPLNDNKTFNIIRNGDTTGIFQLESVGMRQILQNMKTNSLEDIIASSSLFRPGPQDYIPVYIKRKLGQEEIKYLHKDLIPYLKQTYGIIVYQEQILLILQKIAGYSLATADLIRRAISKKDIIEMNLQEKQFLKSGIKNGYSIKIVEKVWSDIKQFAGYGFNRSHAVAYSLIGYWLAYLKANYPLAFMSCLLSSVIGNDQKLQQYLHECQKYNIKILPPSVNYSQLEFAIDLKKNAILYSLLAIKQMSQLTCSNLIKERTEYGYFLDFFTFCARGIFAGLNKRNIEFLIAAGALDELNKNRTMLIANLENAIRYATIVQIKDKVGNVIKLDFSLEAPMMQEVEDKWETNSENEYKALSLYLKFDPEIKWKKALDPESKTISLIEINNYLNKEIKVFGRLVSFKTIRTKNQELMAFAMLKSDNTVVEVTFFPKIYSRYQEFMQLNKILLLAVRVNNYQEKTKLIAEKIIKEFKN